MYSSCMNITHNEINKEKKVRHPPEKNFVATEIKVVEIKLETRTVVYVSCRIQLRKMPLDGVVSKLGKIGVGLSGCLLICNFKLAADVVGSNNWFMNNAN